jgi:hypothetical protein
MEGMEKQTAVEWLVKELYEKFEMKGDGKVFDYLLEEAKEMEKQRMLEFADKYGTYLLQGGTMSATTYNETFKSE